MSSREDIQSLLRRARAQGTREERISLLNLGLDRVGAALRDEDPTPRDFLHLCRAFGRLVDARKKEED
jgi:hypothetical protein